MVEIIRATTEFLKLYPNKKIAIIWDNAAHHKGKLMREALSKGGCLERVHLIAGLHTPPTRIQLNTSGNLPKTNFQTVRIKISRKQSRSL